MDTFEKITVLQEPHCDYKRVLEERAAEDAKMKEREKE